MLLAYISQVSWVNLMNLVFFSLCAYNLFQLTQQRYLIYFLGYKIFFLVYVGWWLIACNLEIGALLLWIVYGSFIVVVFIFTFLWLDVHQLTGLYNHKRLSASQLLVLFFSLVLIFSIKSLKNSFLYIWLIDWFDFYTLLDLQKAAELEFLGWVLSLYQPFLALLISSLLSISCVIAVILIIIAKKTKWLELLNYLRRHTWRRRLIAAAIRKQHLYKQEKNIFLKLNKIYKGYHRRRT